MLAFVGFESANKYSIKNSLGQKVYHAVEGMTLSLIMTKN